MNEQKLPRQQQEYPGSAEAMDPQPHDQMAGYEGRDLLRGRRALVTGGDSGIGRAVAVAFAKEGADVAVAYLSEDDDARRTAKLVEEAGRRCVLIRGDLSAEEACSVAVDRTVSELGGLDILVNNVAYQHPVDAPEDITTQPVHAFTYSVAQALVDRQIRVNCIAPGPVWTPLIPSTMPPEKVESFGGQVPMQRAAQPDEIAPSYVFFASERLSSYYSGEILAPTGGETLPG